MRTKSNSDPSIVSVKPVIKLQEKTVGSDGNSLEIALARCSSENIPVLRINPENVNVGLDEVDDEALVEMLWSTQMHLCQQKQIDEIDRFAMHYSKCNEWEIETHNSNVAFCRYRQTSTYRNPSYKVTPGSTSKLFDLLIFNKMILISSLLLLGDYYLTHHVSSFFHSCDMSDLTDYVAFSPPLPIQSIEQQCLTSTNLWSFCAVIGQVRQLILNCSA
jgi:hypothetical protein